MDVLSITGREIECDGGPNCQATEHIHGCYAERPFGLTGDAGEVERLRRQLQGAVDALKRIRDHGQTHDEPCYALHKGDCADTMQEIARAALARIGGQ